MPIKSARNRVSEKSRADLLSEIADLPPSAFVTTTLAAAYINTRSAFPWFESYQAASASLYDQVWMTGWRFT